MARSTRSESRPFLVLIVDEAADTRDMYHEFLRGDTRLVVVTAPSAEIALEFCHEIRPDVIVADIEATGPTGLSFWNEVRALAGDRVRLVSISSTASARPSFVDAALVKPIDPAALERAVRPPVSDAR